MFRPFLQKRTHYTHIPVEFRGVEGFPAFSWASRLLIADTNPLEIMPRGQAVLIGMRIISPIVDDDDRARMVVLKEVDGNRQIPILVGAFRTAGGDQDRRKCSKQGTLSRSIRDLGGVPKRLIISDLRNGTLSTSLEFRHGKLSCQAAPPGPRSP